MARALLFVLATCTALSAQRTLIVDPNGGQGTFKDIQPAIDAASSGDIIVVRKGDYSGLRIHRKLVTILADPGARVAKGRFQSLIVSGQQTGRIVVRGLRFETNAPGQIAVIGFRGSIIFDGVTMAGQMGLCDFTHANLVHIERCKMQGMLMFQSGTTGSIVDSEIKGVTRPPSSANKQRPTLLLTGTAGRSFYIASSTITGADAGTVQELPGAAIEANGRVRLVIRGAKSRLAAGKGAVARSAIEGGFGTAPIELDPRATIIPNGNAPALVWRGPGSQIRDATLTGTAAVIGTTFDLVVTAEPNYGHLILAGIPIDPVPAGPYGDLGLARPIGLLPGVTNNTSTKTHRLRLPNWTGFRGVVVGWQAVGSTRNKPLRLSNLSVTTIR